MVKVEPQKLLFAISASKFPLGSLDIPDLNQVFLIIK